MDYVSGLLGLVGRLGFAAGEPCGIGGVFSIRQRTSSSAGIGSGGRFAVMTSSWLWRGSRTERPSSVTWLRGCDAS